MPVFHTKTIAQILEPVAEQVSNLVILHENGENGAAMPPLEQAILTVKGAVVNLASVGNEQVKTTKDEVLRLDAPPAIKAVEEAADLLAEAAKLFSSDAFSKAGREKLISGARGILQGTSGLLLVFDEAEVRRIVHVCQSVRDYLNVSEIIHKMEDLITFVKNLTPGIANMAKQVTLRSEDLTNTSHAQALIAKVENIKKRLPNLISSMKAYVTIDQSNQTAKDEAIKSQKFYVAALSEEITEIVHLLLLVSTDVAVKLEKLNIDELHNLYDNVIDNILPVKDWLKNPLDDEECEKEAAFYKTLGNIRSIAAEAGGSLEETMYKKCENLVKKVDSLKQLVNEGKGQTAEAEELKQIIEHSFNDLLSDSSAAFKQSNIINNAVNVIARKSPTLKEWLVDPSASTSPGGNCESAEEISNAAKLIANELIKDDSTSKIGQEILEQCKEVDGFMEKVIEYRKNKQGHLPEARIASKNALQKVVLLNQQISKALTKAVKSGSVELKIKDINDWLNDPEANDGGQGIIAAGNLISMARGLAATTKRAEIRNQTLQKANECEKYSFSLNNLQRQGLGNSAEAYEIAGKLKESFSDLNNVMEDVLAEAVADEFSDTTVMLKQFTKTALNAKNLPNSEVELTSSALALNKQACKLAAISKQAVAASEFSTEEKMKTVTAAAEKLVNLTPHVVNAGKLVAALPENAQAKEHLKAVSNEWMETVDGLTDNVDNAVNVVKFVQASEEGIKIEKEKCLAAMQADEPAVALATAGKLARRTNRVLKVGKYEAENMEDQIYVNNVNECLNDIHNTVSPMVNAAREYVQCPSSESCQKEVELKENDLVRAVSNMRETIATKYAEDKIQSAETDLSKEEAPPIPPLPECEECDEVPPRPPLPEEEDDEEFPEDDDLDDHQMMQAARDLHEETTKWQSRGNDVISAAKKMALLMAKMSQLVRKEDGKKSDLIACAKEIAKASGEVTAISLEIAEKCTDKRIRNDMKRTLDRIPTISTQLRILSTVKATSLGDKEDMTKQEEDAAEQATEMLVHNAQNLMLSVKETVRFAEAASIRIRTDNSGSVQWVRK